MSFSDRPLVQAVLARIGELELHESDAKIARKLGFRCSDIGAGPMKLGRVERANVLRFAKLLGIDPDGFARPTLKRPPVPKGPSEPVRATQPTVLDRSALPMLPPHRRRLA